MKLPEYVYEQILHHARTEAPLEACGYLAGLDGVVQTAHPMRNVDRSPEHFTMDPAEQFEVVRQVRANGQSVLAVYHSHPVTPSRPSAEDLRLSVDPSISYVILSLASDPPVVRSFQAVR